MNAQELTRVYAELAERSITLRREMDDVQNLMRELQEALSERREQSSLHEHKIDDQLKRSEKWDHRAESDSDERKRIGKELDRELAELRQQHALILQKLEVQQKRLEKWDTRLWGVVAITIGAVLSLAAGLIVALVKR